MFQSQMPKKNPLQNIKFQHSFPTNCHLQQQQQIFEFIFFFTPHGNILPYVSATDITAKGYLHVIIPKLS